MVKNKIFILSIITSLVFAFCCIGAISVQQVFAEGDEYTISYTNCDGAVNNNPTNYTVSNLPITLSNPTKEGYEFLSWFVEGDNINPITEISSSTTGNLILNATWRVVEYDILYKNTANCAELPITVKYSIESDFTLENPRKIGYTFMGWYTTSEMTDDSKITTINPSAIDWTLPLGNINLFAKWTVEVLTVTFEPEIANSTTYKPQNFNYNTKFVNLPDAPTKEGYQFVGWYTDTNFQYRYVFTANTVIDENVTLYACYKKLPSPIWIWLICGMGLITISLTVCWWLKFRK